MTEDTEKEGILNVFFASVFTAKISLQEYQPLEVRDKVWKKKDSPLDKDENWVRDHLDKLHTHRSMRCTHEC